MMFWILHGLCNGNPFLKNNVTSDCRPGLEIGLITFCAFQCQRTCFLGQCIHVLPLSLSLCWNFFSVIFNGDPKDLRATSLAQGCSLFSITISSVFLWLGIALPSQATDFCHWGITVVILGWGIVGLRLHFCLFIPKLKKAAARVVSLPLHRSQVSCPLKLATIEEAEGYLRGEFPSELSSYHHTSLLGVFSTATSEG